MRPSNNTMSFSSSLHRTKTINDSHPIPIPIPTGVANSSETVRTAIAHEFTEKSGPQDKREDQVYSVSPDGACMWRAFIALTTSERCWISNTETTLEDVRNKIEQCGYNSKITNAIQSAVSILLAQVDMNGTENGILGVLSGNEIALPRVRELLINLQSVSFSEHLFAHTIGNASFALWRGEVISQLAIDGNYISAEEAEQFNELFSSLADAIAEQIIIALEMPINNHLNVFLRSRGLHYDLVAPDGYFDADESACNIPISCENPEGREDFLKMISQYKFTRSPNNPERSYISGIQAIESGLRILVNVSDVHAAYRVATENVNLSPHTNPDAEGMYSRASRAFQSVYDFFIAPSEPDASAEIRAQNITSTPEEITPIPQDTMPKNTVPNLIVEYEDDEVTIEKEEYVGETPKSGDAEVVQNKGNTLENRKNHDKAETFDSISQLIEESEFTLKLFGVKPPHVLTSTTETESFKTATKVNYLFNLKGEPLKEAPTKKSNASPFFATAASVLPSLAPNANQTTIYTEEYTKWHEDGSIRNRRDAGNHRRALVHANRRHYKGYNYHRVGTFFEVTHDSRASPAKTIDRLLAFVRPSRVPQAQQYMATHEDAVNEFIASLHLNPGITPIEKNINKLKLIKLQEWIKLGRRQLFVKIVLPKLIEVLEKDDAPLSTTESTLLTTKAQQATTQAKRLVTQKSKIILPSDVHHNGVAHYKPTNEHAEMRELRGRLEDLGILIPEGMDAHVLHHLAHAQGGLKKATYQKILAIVRGLNYMDLPRHGSIDYHHHYHTYHHYRIPEHTHHSPSLGSDIVPIPLYWTDKYRLSDAHSASKDKGSIFHQAPQANITYSPETQHTMTNILGFGKDLGSIEDEVIGKDKPPMTDYSAQLANLCGLDSMIDKRQMMLQVAEDLTKTVADLIKSGSFTDEMDKSFRYHFLQSVEERFRGEGDQALIEFLVGAQTGAGEGPGGVYLLMASVDDLNEGRLYSRFSTKQIHAMILQGKVWRLLTSMFGEVMVFSSLLDLSTAMAKGRADVCTYLRTAALLGMAGMVETSEEINEMKPDKIIEKSEILKNPHKDVGEKVIKEVTVTHDPALVMGFSEPTDITTKIQKEISSIPATSIVFDLLKQQAKQEVKDVNAKIMDKFLEKGVNAKQINKILEEADKRHLSETDKRYLVADSLLASHTERVKASGLLGTEYKEAMSKLKYLHPDLITSKSMTTYLHATLLHLTLMEMDEVNLEKQDGLIINSLQLAYKNGLSVKETNLLLAEMLNLSENKKLALAGLTKEEYLSTFDGLIKSNPEMFEEISNNEKYHKNGEFTEYDYSICRMKRGLGAISCLSQSQELSTKLGKYISRQERQWEVTSRIGKVLKIAALDGEISLDAWDNMAHESGVSTQPNAAYENAMELSTASSNYQLRTNQFVQSEILSFAPAKSRIKPVETMYVKATEIGNFKLYGQIRPDLAAKLKFTNEIKGGVTEIELTDDNMSGINAWMKENKYKATSSPTEKITAFAEGLGMTDDYSDIVRDYSSVVEGKHLTITTHGFDSLTATPKGLLDGAELASYIQERYSSELPSLNMIDLKSCKSANGGKWSSQGQLLADKLGIKVKGYYGKFSHGELESESSLSSRAEIFHPRRTLFASLAESLNRQKGNTAREKILHRHPTWPNAGQ